MAIDMKKLRKELKETGRTRCPVCKKGFFIVDPSITFEKQRIYICSNCKEQYISDVKMD